MIWHAKLTQRKLLRDLIRSTSVSSSRKSPPRVAIFARPSIWCETYVAAPLAVKVEMNMTWGA